MYKHCMVSLIGDRTWNRGDQGLKGRGNGELFFNHYKISGWEDEKGLDG